jgi:hypothetical protein
MTTLGPRTACLALVWIALATGDTAAQGVARAPCTYPQTDASLLVTATARPIARIVIDLRSDKGRSLTVTFDASPDTPLVHELRLPGSPGDIWTVSAAGDRAAFATPDGKGSVFMAYLPKAACSANTIDVALHSLVVGLNKTSWVQVDDAPMISVKLSAKAMRLDRIGLADATLDATALVPSTRGLDSAIPDAVRETLSLLAEIAVDRAKAEGARLLKNRIQRYLCAELTIGRVFGTAAHASQRLLPATCGQLDNLRFSDLGASATALVQALREDTIDVVVPALLDALPRVPGADKLRTPMARAALHVASTAARRGFSPDSARMAALSLLDVADIPTPLARALRVAIQCTKQACSLGDVRALMQELTNDLLAAANIPPSFAPLVQFAVTCAAQPGGPNCTGANLQAKIAGLAVTPADIGAGVPDPVRSALALAVQCSATGCTTSDVAAFVAELTPIVIARAAVPGKYRPVIDLAVQCTLQQCALTQFQMLVATLTGTLALADLTQIPDALRAPIDVAVRCVGAGACGPAEIRAFLEALRVVDPFWVDAALRLITIVRPRADADGAKLGGELVDLLLDVVKHECPDRKCEVLATAMRDVSVGVIEADYLRALGGVQAAFVAIGVADRLRGKPLELAASIASYVSTYRETKDKDAGVARDLRKKALEGLIDAATDRSNRPGNWIVSVGASVGFSGGWRRLVTAPASGVDATQQLRDVRLPLGFSVQSMPASGSRLGWGWYGMLGVADLAQFVSSPIERTTTAMNETTTTSIDSETTWSDFVAIELQLGFRFGSARVPLTAGFDIYYRPRARFEIEDTTRSTPILHIGGFIGFNVPFFDLN